VILCSGPIGGSFTTPASRQVLSETEEFVPSRVLFTLFQRDRIFGRDSHATVDVTQNVYNRTWWEERVQAVSLAAASVWREFTPDQQPARPM